MAAIATLVGIIGSALHRRSRKTPALVVMVASMVSVAALASANAQSAPLQPAPQDVGYLEGRILEVTPSQRGADISAGGTATVRLSDGSMVIATVPEAAMYGVTTIEPYEVGDRVEMYFSPSPGGEGRDIVIVDWIRRQNV